MDQHRWLWGAAHQSEIGDHNEKQREYLWDILTSTQTLLAIVDDMTRSYWWGEGERPALH